MGNSKIGIEGNGELIDAVEVTNHNVTREEFNDLQDRVTNIQIMIDGSAIG